MGHSELGPLRGWAWTEAGSRARGAEWGFSAHPVSPSPLAGAATGVGTNQDSARCSGQLPPRSFILLGVTMSLKTWPSWSPGQAAGGPSRGHRARHRRPHLSCCLSRGGQSHLPDRRLQPSRGNLSPRVESAVWAPVPPPLPWRSPCPRAAGKRAPGSTCPAAGPGPVLVPRGDGTPR